jgi:soluble lytic murein transglycosylase-like protein
MRIDIRYVASSAFFLAFVFSNAHAEALNAAAPLLVEGRGADGMNVVGGWAGMGWLTRFIAQNGAAQDNDFPNHNETTAPALPVDPTCHTITTAAAANDLPIEFLTRLIWQESRFDPNAVSRAGAQGVAQFMPKTAVWRGLTDPFDPIQSITKSAELLRDLRTQFGRRRRKPTSAS